MQDEERFHPAFFTSLGILLLAQIFFLAFWT